VKRPPRELTDRLLAVSDRVLAPESMVSIDAASSLTGIPRATLYYHFPGREALIDFLLSDKVARIGTRIDRARNQDADPVAQLTAVLTTTLETIAEHPALCTTLTARLAVLPVDDPLRSAVHRSVLRPLTRLLAAGRAAGTLDVDDPELIAHALYGAVSTAALSRYADEGTIDAGPLADTLVPRLVASVTGGSPAR
jgi:TetR/AcrR family transcriptional regulator